MLSTDLQRVCATLVRQFIFREEIRSSKAMHFAFDISLAFYTDDISIKKRCGLHLLYHCKDSTRYVSVFSAVTSNPFARVDSIPEWKHEATHDSEWANIEFFRGHLSEMAGKINNDLKARQMETVASANLTQFIIPSKSEEFFQLGSC